MIPYIAALAIAQTGPVPTPAAEPVLFEHVFVSGESITYQLEALGEFGGQQFVMDGFATRTVGEVSDSGVSVVWRTDSMNLGLGEMFLQPQPAPVELTLDLTGAPTSPPEMGLEGLLYFAQIAMYLPNRTMSPGETFTLEGESEDGSFSVEGTFEGVETYMGVPTMALRTKLEFEGPQGALELDARSLYHVPSKRILQTLAVTSLMGSDVSLQVRTNPPAGS